MWMARFSSTKICCNGKWTNRSCYKPCRYNWKTRQNSALHSLQSQRKNYNWFSTTPEYVQNSTAVYEEFEGNFGDISSCKTFESLPENAKKYLDRIEEIVKVPIKFIGTGAGRDSMIVC